MSLPPALHSQRPGTPPFVSLESRIIRTFVLAGVVLLAVMTGLTFLVTGRMVEAVEQKEAKRAWERIAAVEKATADRLRALVEDAAAGNAMAAFVEGDDTAGAALHFDPRIFSHTDTDAVLVLSPDDRVLVAAMVARAAADGMTAMPEPLVATLRALPGLEVVRSRGASGLIWLPWNDEWVQAAIGPIGRENEPPNGGVLIILRMIDDERLAERALQAQLPYRIVAFDAERPALRPGGNAAALAVPLGDPVLGTNAMAVARYAYELSGLLQRVQGITVLQQALLLTGLIVLLIRLLSKQVLGRVQALRRDVEAMRHGAIRRTELQGPRDELALLGEDFNAIYRALDGARSDWRNAALRDPLTGLGNRAALQARLEVLFSAGRRWPCSLYLLDLDGFKAINDVHGHATGDALLVALARALVARLGDRAEVFRLGGDEYAIVLHDGGDLGDAALAAIAGVHVPDALGQPLRIRASLGRSALLEGVDSPGDWLRRADIAMYEAKRAGGSRVMEYATSMREHLLERESIERRLRRALDERRIDVAYQPIVAATDGRLTAVEALARWNDAERGRVPPSRFVPIAEEAGFSAELDLMVLEKALPVLVALRTVVPAAVLQVNLAPPSLLSPGLVERIAMLVSDAALPPAALMLEVTESALAGDPAVVAAVVGRLRERGLRIALDDFGTGYSSLARLAELKPSALKIDGEFVRDLDGNGDRIIRSILGLAKAFGLHATAEFVETDAQRDYLRAVGCDALQGYGIAEPMAEAKLLDWAAARAVSGCP